MADLSITAANVYPVDSVQFGKNKFHRDIAGGTITAGQVVYVDSADDNKVKIAGNSNPTVRGIAMTSAADGQPIIIQYAGVVNLGTGGTIVSSGYPYYLSPNTDGGIAPFADLASLDSVSILGTGLANGNAIALHITNTGTTFA